jgi:hypothetical protein
MKKILVFMLALAVNFFAGGLMFAAVGITPIVGGLILNGVAIVSPLFGAPIGAFRATIFTEVWTGEMIKAFRNSMESIGWIAKIRDYSQYSKNDVIHFVDLGGDPTVLVNNTSYPLDIEDLSDTDKPIGLDKYQTKPTRITDDELNAISYDKMGSVIERHREAIDQKKYARALHALAPSANASGTPVLLTTGAEAPDGLRKMLTRADIIKLKKQFDDLKVPGAGRVLVLCPDHVSDLLQSDQKFVEQYHNYTTGKIANLFSFEVFEYTDAPYYVVSAKTKLAFGSVPNSTHRQASIAFYAPRMMKASGSTKAYFSDATVNPQTQENLANFRTYFICLPLKNEAIGAIVSDIAADLVAPTITSDSAVTFAKTASTKEVTVSTTDGTEWTVVNDDPSGDAWLTVTKNGDAVTVAASANNVAEAPQRVGTFTISITGSTVTKVVTVTQAANV